LLFEVIVRFGPGECCLTHCWYYKYNDKISFLTNLLALLTQLLDKPFGSPSEALRIDSAILGSPTAPVVGRRVGQLH
jgi:hypothetical protein